MLVRFSRQFAKNYEKSGSKIKLAFGKRLNLFLRDPLNPTLNNHPLTGKLSNYRSINVTGDWRAIFSVTKNQDKNEVVIFEALGTHSQLYK